MKILLSSEVKEELDDMLKLLQSTCLEKFQIIIAKPDSVIVETIFPVISTNPSFKNKYLQKLSELYQFFNMVLVLKPDLIFTGNSMLKHRIASLILGVPHFGYFRGLLFDSKNISGIMDRFRFGRFKFLFKNKLFNSFYGTLLLTSSDLNKKFMVERGIKEESILVIGPIWLKDLKNNKGSQLKPRVYFVTQAFSAHGMEVQQAGQLNSLKLIVSSLNHNSEIEFQIRVHPRDSYPYHTEASLVDVKVDKSISDVFLKQLQHDDLLISPLSTLAFESLYLGSKVLFYTNEHLERIYGNAYASLNIKPINLNNFDGRSLGHSVLNFKPFSNINTNVFLRHIEIIGIR